MLILIRLGLFEFAAGWLVGLARALATTIVIPVIAVVSRSHSDVVPA